MTAAEALAQAVAAHQQGRLAEAAPLYEAVLAREPQNPDALHLLGLVLAETGQPDRAEALITAALRLRPHAAVFHFNFANLLQAGGKLHQALAHFDLAAGLDATNPQIWFNRGNCLSRMGHNEDSLASFAAALKLRPDYAAAALNRGVALQGLGRFEEAIAAFQGVVEQRPDHVQGAVQPRQCAAHPRPLGRGARHVRTRGGAQSRPCRCPQQSRQCPAEHPGPRRRAGGLWQALALNPDHANARFNQSLVQLRLGRLRGRVARLLSGASGSPPRSPIAATPCRPGSERGDISGKRVFLHWEQGLGDSLQFCRYAPLVQARGAQVVLSVPDPLVRLARTLAEGIEVISTHAVPSASTCIVR